MHSAIDLAYVRLQDGTVTQLGLGDPVPEDADQEHVATLLAADVLTLEAVTPVVDDRTGEQTGETTIVDVEPEIPPVAADTAAGEKPETPATTPVPAPPKQRRP